MFRHVFSVSLEKHLMRKLYVFFFQKITLKVLDYNTNTPIEKAPIFYQ
jgi:hypothetical protein